MRRLLIFIIYFFFLELHLNASEVDSIIEHFKKINNVSFSFKQNINDKEEKGKFTLINNILSVEWENWDDEYFVHNLDKVFYKCHKFNFFDENWEDICYIDYKNDLIFRNSCNLYGRIEYLLEDTININWKEIDFEFINKNINIKYFNNNYFGKIENNIPVVYSPSKVG